MKKSFRTIFLFAILGVFLVEIPLYSTLHTTIHSYDINDCNLRASEGRVRWSGNILLKNDNYYLITGFVDHSFSFNFKSIDSDNNSVYIDLNFLVMDEDVYDNFLFCLNRSNNLFQIVKSYQIRESIVGDESHYCSGSYRPSHAQILHLIFINLNQDQKTSNLTYTIRFEELLRPEPVQDDDGSTSPIEVLPVSIISLPLLLVIISSIMTGIILLLSISKSYTNYHKLQLDKTLELTKSCIECDPVVYCSCCGFKLIRVVKYCPRCGEEIDY